MGLVCITVYLEGKQPSPVILYCVSVDNILKCDVSKNFKLTTKDPDQKAHLHSSNHIHAKRGEKSRWGAKLLFDMNSTPTCTTDRQVYFPGC